MSRTLRGRMYTIAIANTAKAVSFCVFMGFMAGLLAIGYFKKSRFIAVVFGVMAFVAFAAAYLKPGIDRAEARKDHAAKLAVLAKYPSINRIIDLDRNEMTITYVTKGSRRCNTTVVHRDGRWLVNTQTADCAK